MSSDMLHLLICWSCLTVACLCFQEQATVFSRTRLAFGLDSFKYYTEQKKFPVCD